MGKLIVHWVDGEAVGEGEQWLDGELDFTKTPCGDCGRLGVTRKAADVFSTDLCEQCFWRVWHGYCEAATGKKYTREDVRHMYDGYEC